MAKNLSDTLTDMQLKFVEHYLITLNATKSAMLAGYSSDTAEQQGYQLLQKPSVSRELRKRMRRRAKRLEITAENVLREISRIAFSDIRAVCDFDADLGVRFKDSNNMHQDAAAAIQSVQSDVSVTGSGRDREPVTTTTIKLKLHDKLRALDLAGRHLGLWAGAADDDKAMQPIALAYVPKSERKEPA